MVISVPPHGLLATASHREEETSMGCLRATMAATLLDGQHLAARPLWFANATLPIYLCVSTPDDRIDGYANPRRPALVTTKYTRLRSETASRPARAGAEKRRSEATS